MCSADELQAFDRQPFAISRPRMQMHMQKGILQAFRFQSFDASGPEQIGQFWFLTLEPVLN